MTKISVQLPRVGSLERSPSNAAAGAYDTAAPLYTHAAQIRNVTLVAGSIGRSWADHAGIPETPPVVTDQPPD